MAFDALHYNSHLGYAADKHSRSQVEKLPCAGLVTGALDKDELAAAIE